MTYRSRYADDFVRLAAQYNQLFAYGVFIREGALRKLFVDDDSQRRLRRVIPIEIAPAKQRHAERAEITRRDITNLRHRIIGALLAAWRPVSGAAAALAAQRQIAHAAADLRSRQRRNALLQLAQERGALGDNCASARFARRISRLGLLRIVHHRRQHVFSLEPRMNRRQPPRAADE